MILVRLKYFSGYQRLADATLNALFPIQMLRTALNLRLNLKMFVYLDIEDKRLWKSIYLILIPILWLWFLSSWNLPVLPTRSLSLSGSSSSETKKNKQY